MSNPARAPKEYTDKQLALGESPDSFLPDNYGVFYKAHKSPEAISEALLRARVDMEVRPAFYLPKELTSDPAVLQKKGPALALAKTGAPTPRSRTSHAKLLVTQCYRSLPTEGPFSREAVASAMRNRVFVDGGAENALGRIMGAYPKIGDSPAKPVTRVEAEHAVRRSGVMLDHLPTHARRPYPLNPVEGEGGVTVNAQSDNGFPVGEKWSSPGAAVRCMGLAVTMRGMLTKTASVEATLRGLEATAPHLVAVKGKAKADYYSQEKVVEGRMRFYNVLPRHMMIIMQQATQVLELNSKNILQGDYHSGSGMTLVRGGGADLVEALQRQIEATGRAFVHVGDDSWVVIRRDGTYYMFALDCSNFDLTQHAEVTREVHAFMRGQLRLVDRVSAELWHTYARGRLTVVSRAITRFLKHAGPSGMPLQSKVNDVLMDVMIHRTLESLEGGELTEERIAAAVETEGSAMGFKVKLEQMWSGRVESLREALELRPFLFIGYYFHSRAGEVRVCADIPRTMAQLPFPTLKWSKTKQELKVVEAMRLGSIYLNLGMPTRDLEPMFDVFRGQAVGLLEEVIAEFGDQQNDRLRWAVQEVPWGAPTLPSLSGLLSAVKRDPRFLWVSRERELPSSSQFLMPSGVPTWADEVEEEEEEEAVAAGSTSQRPAQRRVVAVPINIGAAPTHQVSSRNDGRPPPTAVWAPDKPARPRPQGGVGGRARYREGLDYRQHQQDLRDEEDEYYAGNASEEDDGWL